MEPGLDVKAVVVDYKHAYKNIPIAKEHMDLASILIGPPTGELMVAQVRALPFGPRRSPANWARLTLFVQWLLRTVLKVVLYVYIDDCFTIEPAATIDSADMAIRELNAILGLPLAPEKSFRPSAEVNLLGATVTLMNECVEATLPRKKRNELIHDLRQILMKGALSPAAAGKIRGRLGWAQSLLFGRFGRAHPAPFTARQYSKSNGRVPISTELREVLTWWIAMLSNPVPRRISYKAGPPILIYTDACGAGHVGAVVF